MNQFVFVLHLVIVAAVPCLFGWVLLRRVVREHDLLVLIPGTLVAGCLSFMALLNELRFYMEMPVALWTSYKVLLLSTAAIVIATKPLARPVMVAKAGRSRLHLSCLAGAAGFVGVYFGIPAFNGILNDAWWFHYPEAVFIQTTERFPLMLAFAPDDMLYYHYGPDLLAAAWSFLLEKSVPFAFALNIVLFSVAALMLAYAIMLRVTRHAWAAGAAALFLVIGGNLRFLGLFTTDWSNPAGLLQVLNSQTVESLLEMVFTPSHVVGVPAVLLGIILFRHFAQRPSWSLGILLGLWLGMLTLIAEWYFVPFFASIGLWGALRIFGYIKRANHAQIRQKSAVVLVPLVTALAWGTFNNTYLAGMFGHFWLRPASALSATSSRVVLQRASEPATLDQRTANQGPDGPGLATGGPGLGTGGSSLGTGRPGLFRETGSIDFVWTPHLDRFSAPNLVPIQLNISNLGQLPSWESAGSDSGTFISIVSWDAFLELFPVMLIGLPYGIWWLRKRQSAIVYTLVVMGGLSVLPPVFLNWGYRSTDFLRFFTGAFSWSALLMALPLASLWIAGGWLKKSTAAALTLIILANAAGLGIAGLIPGTVAAAKSAGSSASSLSEISAAARESPVGPAVELVNTGLHLERLARQADSFLFPLSKGRDRVLFLAPQDQLPPLEKFPEWMKLPSFARVIVPVGRHWNSSLLPTLYRAANESLDADALTALGVKWLFVSDLYSTPSEAAARELADPTRFRAVKIVRSGVYSMIIYRVL
jgi:hypothetical protein